MTLLQFYAYQAANTARMRDTLRRTGFTLSGKKLWTDDEVAVLKAYAPDYDECVRRLPHRTRKAVMCQAHLRGLGARRPDWTMTDIAKLRKLFPMASKSALLAAFPTRTWHGIEQAARTHGAKRDRSPLKITGFPILDQIKARTQEIGWTMKDLDAEARTGNYFDRQSYRRALHQPSPEKLVRAILALGGTIEINWGD